MIQKLLEMITVSRIRLHYLLRTLHNYFNYFIEDCTFLIESLPGTQIQLNATISILNKKSNEECMDWLKFYDFHSNATLVPFGE